MNLRDFRIGWRLLWREPGYSAVVVLGLAVGVAVCYLLLGMVRNAFNFESKVPDSDRIYLVKQLWNTAGSDHTWGYGASLPARDALTGSGLPLLVSAAIHREVDARIDARVMTVDVLAVDADYPRIFGLRALAGDLDATLRRPDALALTRATAERLFGAANALGRVVQIGGNPYTVTALLPDMPEASTIGYEALAGSSTRIWPDEYRKLVTTNWGSSHGDVFFKLRDGATTDQALATLRRTFLASGFNQRLSPAERAATGGRDLIEFKAASLRERYLDPEVPQQSATRSRLALAGLSAVAVLILVLAATNYVNLATVRTLRRQREIAMRKVLGASAGRVVRQFLAESVLVSLIATAFGLLLAWLLLPAFGAMLGRTFDDFFELPMLAGALGGAIVLGILGGAYPAWAALRMRPSSALAGRGNAETAGGLWLRRVLTVVQFATAMALTCLTVAIAWQTRYAANLDPGFDPARMTIVETHGDLRDANVNGFRAAVAALPGVSGVAAAGADVTHNYNFTALERDGREAVNLNWLWVSADWFDVHGLKPLAGRLYAPATDGPANDNVIVINAAAARKLGFASNEAAVGAYVKEQGIARQVIGVAPDIRHRSAKEAMQATMYRLGKRTGVFTVLASGDRAAVQAGIEGLWPRFFPNDLLIMNNAESYFARAYADDRRMAALLAASSVVAAAIAAFGIYVLAAYSVQRRGKEIVLRKLYGADARAIALLVGREFGVLLGAAALIGLPLAWLGTERYLASFIERAPVEAPALALALGVALLVALFSTVRHTLGALRMTPAALLRD